VGSVLVDHGLASARPVRAALDSLGQLRSCIDHDPAGAELKNVIKDRGGVASRNPARARRLAVVADCSVMR